MDYMESVKMMQENQLKLAIEELSSEMEEMSYGSLEWDVADADLQALSDELLRRGVR